MLCREKFDRGRQVEKQMYICRLRECSPLQEIETKVGGRTPCSLSVSADGSYGRGYWGGSVTVGMCDSGSILLCEHNSPALSLLYIRQYQREV
jgi:hypothetical protein